MCVRAHTHGSWVLIEVRQLQVAFALLDLVCGQAENLLDFDLLTLVLVILVLSWLCINLALLAHGRGVQIGILRVWCETKAWTCMEAVVAGAYAGLVQQGGGTLLLPSEQKIHRGCPIFRFISFKSTVFLFWPSRTGTMADPF